MNNRQHYINYMYELMFLRRTTFVSPSTTEFTKKGN